MKLIFFLLAFCLLSIRVYFSWAGKDREKKGVATADMVIKSNNFYEEIKYSGKFQLTDEETGFKSISPGGYLKFRRNDESVKAESNLQGEIEYKLYDGQKNLTPDDESGRKLIADAVHEMIAWGFDADSRMERVYRKGGIRALLNEVDSMRTDQVKTLYLDRVFRNDSLSSEDLLAIAGKIGSLGSDMDKSRFLNKFSAVQLKNPQVDSVYFKVVGRMGSDMDKANALQHIINQDSIADENVFQILALGGGFGSDMDKSNLFGKLIDRGLIGGARFDSLVSLISNMGADMDKVNLYRKLMAGKSVT